jgi:hypothetical protein
MARWNRMWRRYITTLEHVRSLKELLAQVRRNGEEVEAVVGRSALLSICEPSIPPTVAVGDSQSAKSGYSGTRATCIGITDKELVSDGSVNGGKTGGEKSIVSGWKRRYCS